MASKSENLPQWYIDLTTPPSKPKSSNIPDPPGFSSATKVWITQVYPSKSKLTTLPAVIIQTARAKTSNNRGNRHTEAEKSLGARYRASKVAAHERNNDVYVRQYFADFQHHDGIHAV